MTPPPYRVERVDGDVPSCRIVGPGVTSKMWDGAEQRERLAEIVELMNFGWEQCRRNQHANSVEAAR